MRSLLWKTSVVYDPRHNRAVLLHRGEHLLSHLRQHRLVVPRCIGHQVVEGLVHVPDIVGSQARRHRLDTLPIPR
jgi:hypothetical protein